MEGKKCRAICKNCQAVSEVYGQLLMISIVILSFSTIALTVFSDGGAVDPPHTPHIDLREKINTNTNQLYLTHSGGEAIDLSAIKIILVVADGQQYEFLKPDFMDPDDTVPDDDVFTLGDCIVVSDESIKSGVDIDMFFVDMPSQQVIQRAVLQRGPGKLPPWITPHPYGSVYDSTSPSGLLPMELVSTIGDGRSTGTVIPNTGWVYQNYSFGIDSDEMGISNFSKIELKIIYQTGGDSSIDQLKLAVYNGSKWTQIAPKNGSEMVEYHTFSQCIADDIKYPLYDPTDNVAEYIINTDELEKLEVSFSALGHASSIKSAWVDFIGIHIE